MLKILFLCGIMSLYISSLNSGSNGNCYYIGNQQEAVLIDAGISCRETELRMIRSGLDFRKVKAVFITHEHSDHTKGIAFIVRKYQIPVYISVGTYSNSRLKIDRKFLRHFEPYSAVEVGGLSVNAFPKFHDANDPHSFTVSGNGIVIGVLTDIGSACDHVIKNFSLCNAAFLEANYDEDMLENGRYPVYLKNRIRSDYGHLSNHQALELFTKYKSAKMSHLLLSHLSQDNNDPHLVERIFNRYAGETHISIASRHQESPVYHITSSKADRTGNKTYPLAKYIQTTLF